PSPMASSAAQPPSSAAAAANNAAAAASFAAATTTSPAFAATGYDTSYYPDQYWMHQGYGAYSVLPQADLSQPTQSLPSLPTTGATDIVELGSSSTTAASSLPQSTPYDMPTQDALQSMYNWGYYMQPPVSAATSYVDPAAMAANPTMTDASQLHQFYMQPAPTDIAGTSSSLDPSAYLIPGTGPSQISPHFDYSAAAGLGGMYGGAGPATGAGAAGGGMAARS
ncbi:hypothetical protein PFISCL1PPCAC_19073, partial [Pristionchus fissidentatus]